MDISNWKPFECKKLFECKNTGNILARDVVDGSGNIPFVTASAYNNGVVAHIDASGYEIIKGDCILVGGKTFTITYQKDDFVSNDSHNFVIRSKQSISDLAYLFLTTVIYNYFGQKYSWNDAVTKDKFLKESIPLPAKNDHTPDWEYMESYMKKQKEHSIKYLDTANQLTVPKHLISIENWKKYPITDLFNLSLPKGDLQVKQVKDGTVLLITPSAYNNGLLKRISAESDSTLYEKNCITVDMFGNAYFHKEQFFVTAHGHVNVLIPKIPLNVYLGTYLATSIKTMFLDKYGFNEMCTLKILKAESLYLPADKNGNPDWAYMELYMKSMMNECEHTISTLKLI